jgi:hypothetical protein
MARSAAAGGQNPEFILREFEGMNNLAAREAINDNEFSWLENLMPIAPGVLCPVPTALLEPGAVSETTRATYATTFSTNGASFGFVVFAGSGNAYIVELFAGFTWTRIYTGGLNSGQTYATAYNNQGLLIVDPTGYWDYGVTTPGVLTPQNNTVSGTTPIIVNRMPGASSLKQVVAALGPASGATFQTVYEVVLVALTSGGSGYAVGDTINLTDNNPTTPAQIIVATIAGSGPTGAVTGITLASGGSYPGPTSLTPTVTGPSGAVTSTTGAGAGAEFSPTCQAIACNVLTVGTGYTGGTVSDEQSSSGTVYDSWSIESSGIISGTSIATYAGRVWIGYGRTVYFTDIDRYNSFGGVGGFFSIPDSYLVGSITVLFGANNYLYIFGQSSIDALSNVTVSAGVTSFSRINVVADVGCSAPASVCAYYRAIVFYHSSGVYLLAGATPEKISEKISGIIQNVTDQIQVYGGSVLVQGELCLVIQFLVNDQVVQFGIRPLMAIFFRGRWYLYSFGTNSSPQSTAFLSMPINGIWTLFGLRPGATFTSILRCFAPLAALSSWVLKTKLWDGGSPIHEKQSLNALIAGNWVGSITDGITLNVDCENASSVALPISVPGAGYQWQVTQGNISSFQGAQYLGLTVLGSTDMTQINMLALKGVADRNILS